MVGKNFVYYCNLVEDNDTTRKEAKRTQFLPVFGQLAVSQAYLNLINLVTSHVYETYHAQKKAKNLH